MCQKFNLSLQIQLFYEKVESRLESGGNDKQESWKGVSSEICCLNFGSILNVTLNFAT